MSPEQATGELTVGGATDVYALGCVLYEMLVGEPPYTGSTPQAVLGKIVTAEADRVTKHRRSVPENVDATIRRALEKVPADRFAIAGDFARALADASFRHGPPGPSGAATGARGLWNPLSIGLTVLSAALAIALGWSAASKSAPTAPLVRFRVQPPPGEAITGWRGFAGSPDGRTLVFADQQTGQLYRRDTEGGC